MVINDLRNSDLGHELTIHPAIGELRERVMAGANTRRYEPRRSRANSPDRSAEELVAVPRNARHVGQRRGCFECRKASLHDLPLLGSPRAPTGLSLAQDFCSLWSDHSMSMMSLHGML